MKELHSQKIRALMKSVESYKKEIESIKASNKTDKKSKQIKQLQKDVRDAEFVSEILKKHICDKFPKDVDTGEKFSVEVRHYIRFNTNKHSRWS